MHAAFGGYIFKYDSYLVQWYILSLSSQFLLLDFDSESPLYFFSLHYTCLFPRVAFDDGARLVATVIRNRTLIFPSYTQTGAAE